MPTIHLASSLQATSLFSLLQTFLLYSLCWSIFTIHGCLFVNSQSFEAVIRQYFHPLSSDPCPSRHFMQHYKCALIHKAKQQLCILQKKLEFVGRAKPLNGIHGLKCQIIADSSANFWIDFFYYYFFKETKLLWRERKEYTRI